MPKGSKQWLHPSDALTKGHILYTVKFLGECKVDQPKGTEVVKSAITKMKFNKHIKRAEGQKPPKVELTISAEAVKILDPKSKSILHQYPLHRISYCADDKSDKRMFTFIGKAADNNDHFCYVFDSEKCAEEITLTIGQAFELAYKKFIETSTPDADLRKQFMQLQRKVNTLQYENDVLKKRLVELEKMKDRADMEQYKVNNQLNDITSVRLNLRESSTDDDDSPVFSEKPSNQSSVVGRRLENLILTEDNHSPQTNGSNGHATTKSPFGHTGAPVLSPPPPNTRPTRSASLSNTRMNSLNNTNNNNTGIGGPTTNHTDAFGMQAFNPAPPTQQELMDIHDGFTRGLSFGTDDFNLNDLDPLNQR